MAPPRKVSIRQTEILADFAVTHQHIALGGRFCSLQGLKDARRAWESVAVRLNAVGLKKTLVQWRRYWIEYKAKLKSKAADSRRGAETGPGGRLIPLSDREQELLELINRVAAERLPDPEDDMQGSSIQTSSPESQPNSLEVEWLDYDSESDEQLDKEESDGSLFVEPQSDYEPVDVLQTASETDDEVPGPVKKRLKKRDAIRKKIQHTERLSRSHRFGELYKDGGTPLQNNMINTSSSIETDQQDVDTKSKRSSLSDVTATNLEYFHSKRNKSAEAQNPDMLFFYSILPEMKQMSPEQKRQFKMGVWSLASQILEPNTIDSPSDHNYGLIVR